MNLEHQKLFNLNYWNFEKEVRRLIDAYKFQFDQSTDVEISSTIIDLDVYFYIRIIGYDSSLGDIIEKSGSYFYPYDFKYLNMGNVKNVEELDSNIRLTHIVNFEGYLFKSNLNDDLIITVNELNNNIKKLKLEKFKIVNNLMGIPLVNEKKKEYNESLQQHRLPEIDNQLTLYENLVLQIENGEFN
jgi:hypothetical protein